MKPVKMFAVSTLVLLLFLGAACGGVATPEPTEFARAVEGTVAARPPVEIEVTRIVEKPVEVEVTRIVEKPVEVTRIVEVEVTKVVEIVVTPTSAPEPPTPTPTTQQPIELGEPIVVTRKAYDGTTRLDIFLMLKNPNPDWWLPVSRVTLSVFDAAGNIIATDSNVVFVPPGQSAPFLLTGVDIGDRVHDRLKFELEAEEMRSLSRWPGAAVELVQANLVGNKIVGQIKNIGEVEIPQTKIIVVVQNADGEVIALDFAYADESQPDRIVPFDLDLGQVEENIEFEIYLQPELVSGTW